VDGKRPPLTRGLDFAEQKTGGEIIARDESLPPSSPDGESTSLVRGRPKVGWDGRAVVKDATGQNVTVGGKTYVLLGYDEKGSRVYQDAEVLREQAEAAANTKESQNEEGQNAVENAKNHDIMKTVEMFKQDSDERRDFKPLSQKRFDDLTIEVRKNGATIIRGTQEVESHLKHVGASASVIGDVLMFRADATIGEVLEETYHFMQNRKGINDDKGEPLRTYLNEIDAKEYIIQNAGKYHVPRNEVDLAKRELEYYKNLLKEYNGGKE